VSGWWFMLAPGALYAVACWRSLRRDRAAERARQNVAHEEMERL